MISIKRIPLLFLSLIFLATHAPSEAVTQSELHPSSECCVDVVLEYTSPSDSEKSSKYGVYVMLLNINTEFVTTDLEVFDIVRGKNKKSEFHIHMRPTETIVAFVVSFDHDFTAFNSSEVGTLTAEVHGKTVRIPLTEYESNEAIAFFNVPRAS